MPDVTRIIEQTATELIYNDDWALIDRPTEGEDGGTRKILVSRLKELLCGDYIADEWVTGEIYTNGAIVSHEGKLYYNNSGGALVQTTFNSKAWLEVKIDELLEKVIGSIGKKWRRVDTYHQDDLVVYGGRLYRCIKNTSTQGTWVRNEWIEANAEYYFKKVREYIARYDFVPSGEGVVSPYNKGDLILYRAPGDTTNSLYMRLNDTEYGDPTWIPENWLKVENIGGALSKIYDDMEESSCDVQIKEQSIVDENRVADLTSLAVVGSASGAIATFDDGSALPMPSLKVSIEPYQEGSGDPSPANVRPISGWDEVKVTVADDAESPTTSHEYTIDLDGTRYGGKLDVVSGVLTVDRAEVDLGSLSWKYSSETNKERFSAMLSGVKWVSDSIPINAICSALVVTDFYTVYNHATDNTIGMWHGTTLAVYSSAYTDATAFKTAMNGVQLVYELANPITYQLTPTAVKSLSGVNNVWADTGDVLAAEYIRDMTTIINSLIARIEALENQ